MSSWRDRHLGVVGVVSIVALLGVTLLVGCGGGSSPAGSAGSNQTTAPSDGSMSTVAGTSAGTSNTASTAHPAHAPARSTKVPAPNSTQGAPPPVGGRLLRRFAGSGNTRLGTIVVSSPAVLLWRAQHPAIQIFTAKGFMLVSSHASSGGIQLSRGTYPGMRVASRAGWSIELRTRS
jgi:hypothetical protein